MTNQWRLEGRRKKKEQKESRGKKRGPRKVRETPYTTEKHEINDYTYVLRTEQSCYYQFRTRKDGKYIRKTLKTKQLDKALERAEGLYKEIHC